MAHNDYLSVSDEIFNELAKSAISFVYFGSEKDNISFMLLSRVMEFCHGCLSLLREGIVSPVPVLLRSIWEAFLDISIVMKSDDGYLHVLADWYFESIKKLEKLNELGVESSFCEQRNSAICEYKRKYEELVKKGFRRRRQEEKIKLSGVDKFVGLVNSYYSCDSHNNIISLVRHHTEGGRFGDDIVFLKKHVDNYDAFLMHYVFLFTLGALVALSEKYDCDKIQIARISELVESFGEMFAKIKPQGK